MRLYKQGQNIVEYTILIVIVIGAFIAASTYVKRGIQGRWKDAVDEFGQQYDPTVMVTSLNFTLNASTNTYITTTSGTFNGIDVTWTERRDVTNSVDKKTGQTTVGAY